MDLPKILLAGLFFLFFWFSSSFWTVGAWDTKKPREKPNKPKKTKKTILNGLTQDSSHRIVFFVFFGFPRVFGQLGLGTPKNLEKNQINQKKQKKQSWMDLPKILLTGLVFFGFPRVFGQLRLGTPKTSRKTRKTKKTKKIWNRLTPDSSHRIGFFVSFWFSLTFWTYGKVEMKKREKTWKNKRCKNPTLPASLSVILFNATFDTIASPTTLPHSIPVARSPEVHLLSGDLRHGSFPRSESRWLRNLPKSGDFRKGPWWTNFLGVASHRSFPGGIVDPKSRCAVLVADRGGTDTSRGDMLTFRCWRQRGEFVVDMIYVFFWLKVESMTLKCGCKLLSHMLDLFESEWYKQQHYHHHQQQQQQQQ